MDRVPADFVLSWDDKPKRVSHGTVKTWKSGAITVSHFRDAVNIPAAVPKTRRTSNGQSFITGGNKSRYQETSGSTAASV